jgi:hypothetical protein
MGYADKSQEFFLARFLPAPAAPQQAPTLSAGGKTELLMGKPNSISDFLQSTIAPTVPFESLNPKAGRRPLFCN